MENIMSGKMLGTRRGTVILGIVVAVLAAIALLVYLRQYRNSVNTAVQPASVLVAKSLIQKGTPGEVIASTGLYQVTTVPHSDLKSGAFVDPKTLTGKVAQVDVYPGQQLTEADFGTTAPNSLTQNLAPTQRAVVIPLDSPAEVGGQIGAGDHVDVWVAFTAESANGVARPIARATLQNVYVMGSSGGNVTLRATSQQAGELIFANQNAKIWLVLRPAVGTVATKPPVITSNDLLGLTPLRVGG